MYGYLRNCLWQTSLGITACGAAVPCGLIHNTLLALPEIKRATVGCKGKIRERKSESVHYLCAFKFPAKGRMLVFCYKILCQMICILRGGSEKKWGVLVARGKHDEEINLHSEGKRGRKKTLISYQNTGSNLAALYFKLCQRAITPHNHRTVLCCGWLPQTAQALVKALNMLSGSSLSEKRNTSWQTLALLGLTVPSPMQKNTKFHKVTALVSKYLLNEKC